MLGERASEDASLRHVVLRDDRADVHGRHASSARWPRQRSAPSEAGSPCDAAAPDARVRGRRGRRRAARDGPGDASAISLRQMVQRVAATRRARSRSDGAGPARARPAAMKPGFVDALRCPACRSDHTLAARRDRRATSARSARARSAARACGARVRGASRRARAAARAAGARRRRGGGARALRRAHARARLGSRVHPAPAGRRARLLVRAGALDAPAADDDPVPARPDDPRRRRRTRAGRRTTSPSGACGRSRSTSPRPSCRGCTRPTTSSTTATSSSSACSARCTRSRSPRAASTTSTAARSCTTTTRDSLRRTFAEIFRVLRPGGRLLMVNETLKTLRDPHGVHVEEVAQFEGYEHAHWAAELPLGRDRAPASSPTSPSPTTGRSSATPTCACRRGRRRLTALLRRLGFALRRSRLARRVYLLVAQPRVGRRVDEHGRHQALALRRPPRARRARRCGSR